MKQVSLLLLLLPALQSHAQKQVPINIKDTAFYNRAITGLKPIYKNYIKQNSIALHNRKINADSLRKATKANALFAGMKRADIDVITMLIVLEANADVYKDLANLANEMEKTRQKKEALRAQEERLTAQKKTDSNTIKKIAYKDINDQLARTKKEKNAVEKVSTEMQLQLQQLMEKKNQLETMLSNMMKAAGDTQSNIINNLK